MGSGKFILPALTSSEPGCPITSIDTSLSPASLVPTGLLTPYLDGGQYVTKPNPDFHSKIQFYLSLTAQGGASTLISGSQLTVIDECPAVAVGATEAASF